MSDLVRKTFLLSFENLDQLQATYEALKDKGLNFSQSILVRICLERVLPQIWEEYNLDEVPTKNVQP
jgi:hypothetical protein